MPHFYRYTGNDEDYTRLHQNVELPPGKDDKPEAVHVNLLGMEAELAVCGDHENKINISSMFNKLDRVIANLRQENEKVREEASAVREKLEQSLKICEENEYNMKDKMNSMENDMKKLRIKVDFLEKQQNDNEENTKANVDQIMAKICNLDKTETIAVSPIEQNIDAIRELRKDIANDLSECKLDESSSMSVMFDAVRTEDFKGEDAFLSFNSADVNLGAGLDVATGKFTAPVAGIYLFSLHVYGAPRDPVVMSIRQVIVREGAQRYPEGTEVTEVPRGPQGALKDPVVMSIRVKEEQDIGSISGVGKGGQVALVELEEKETCGVWVEAKTKINDGTNSHYTHFIGILLKPKQKLQNV